MTGDYPTPPVPPPELANKLLQARLTCGELVEQGWLVGYQQAQATIAEREQAAADGELEACCEWLRDNGLYETRVGHLRAARRPKPPSLLKEQALQALTKIEDNEATYLHASIIRRALEALPD